MSIKILEPSLFSSLQDLGRKNYANFGIADKQTGIYPIKSPGGWQIIARSPLNFFDKQNQKKPVLLEAGMFLKFNAIDKKEYYEIKEAVDKNAYTCF